MRIGAHTAGPARQGSHEMPHVRSGAVVTVVADSRRQGLATPASVTDMRRSYRREATADFDEDLEGD